jgi:hypothetical protein
MLENHMSPKEKEEEFNRFIITEYLKYGSVDELFRRHSYNLPISYAGVQRLLDKWGIVKAAGPNTRLSEALAFLSGLSNEKIPLETLYRNMPPSFKTSMGTLHRILTHVRAGTIRRVGTALVVSPGDNPSLVLVANDVSTPRLEVGKPFGSISLPMGYSRRTENKETSILRVLQQEVFTKQVIDRSLSFDKVLGSPNPFMYIDIADVRVAVYSLSLPDWLSATQNFSSFKIKDHRYLHVSEIVKGKRNFRAGIREIALGYKRFLMEPERDFVINPIWQKSVLNFELAFNLALE